MAEPKPKMESEPEELAPPSESPDEESSDSASDAGRMPSQPDEGSGAEAIPLVGGRQVRPGPVVPSLGSSPSNSPPSSRRKPVVPPAPSRPGSSRPGYRVPRPPGRERPSSGEPLELSSAGPASPRKVPPPLVRPSAEGPGATGIRGRATGASTARSASSESGLNGVERPAALTDGTTSERDHRTAPSASDSQAGPDALGSNRWKVSSATTPGRRSVLPVPGPPPLPPNREARTAGTSEPALPITVAPPKRAAVAEEKSASSLPIRPDSMPTAPNVAARTSRAPGALDTGSFAGAPNPQAAGLNSFSGMSALHYHSEYQQSSALFRMIAPFVEDPRPRWLLALYFLLGVGIGLGAAFGLWGGGLAS